MYTIIITSIHTYNHTYHTYIHHHHQCVYIIHHKKEKRNKKRLLLELNYYYHIMQIFIKPSLKSEVNTLILALERTTPISIPPLKSLHPLNEIT